MSGGHIFLADDFKLNVGTGDDLQIYHDGSHSYINNTGTGHLYIIDAGIVKIQSESLIFSSFLQRYAASDNGKRSLTTSDG